MSKKQTPQEVLSRLPELYAEGKALLDWRLEWLESAHMYQLAPTNQPWDIWMLIAGRGAGKTKCASNELGWLALACGFRLATLPLLAVLAREPL
jgi:phage terminase large subunit-like protein